MTEYEKRINRAMNEVKKKYGHECIICGHHVEVVVGAHLFKRSEYPEWAAWPENILPLCGLHDGVVEAIRDPWKRICCIFILAHESLKIQVFNQMIKLIELATTEEVKKKDTVT